MKFTCDRCSAQYMISDEKVGPAGAKVRCKKCGHVILVKRAAAEGANGAAAPAPAPERGLDVELGQAFDTAFGDAPAKPAGPAPDPDATQAMGREDAERITASAAPAATEWYVAIGQAQVGPLPLAEVKKKWEAGDVGPESLVWRPGMGDWSKLTTVKDLSTWLAAIPRAPARAARPAEPRLDAPAPHAAAPASPAPAAEVTWKPAGASALAALASEELSNRAAPEPKAAAAPRAAAPGGSRSLVESMDLPDGGGVDPTGALPLPIKALEKTGEKKLTAVARGAEQTRRRRSSRLLGVFAGVVLLGGGAAAGAWLYVTKQPLGSFHLGGSSAVAVAPPAQAPAPQPAVAAAPPAAPPAPAAEAPPAAAAPAEKLPAVDASAAQAARREPPPPAPPREPARREPTRREPTRVAEASRQPPPAPTPTPPPARRKADVLEFETNDAALEAALGGGGGSSSRSVYVPPPAGATALPAKLSADQINEAVLGRVDALRRCVSEQKARDPEATGTLKMQWVVGPDGGVRNVKTLTPEFADGQFAHCITGVVKSVRFPRSTTTGQEVTFPFRF